MIACLESLAAQTVKPGEVLLVDNGSEPGTHDDARRAYPGVRIIEMPSNVGCPAGRNVGMRAATTPWVFSLDDDATAPPTMVETLLRAIERWPDAAVIAGSPRDSAHEAPEELAEEPVTSFIGCAAALRRAPFHEVGGFPEDGLRQGEERHLTLKLADRGYAVIRVPEVWIDHTVDNSPEQRALIVRNTVRQDVVTIARLSPLWMVVPLEAAQLARNLYVCTRAGHLGSALAGLSEGVRTLPSLRGHREPVRASTLWRLASGRPPVSSRAR